MFGHKPGHRIIKLVETDSTNSYAARLLYGNLPEEGVAIVAGYQNAGRGQRGTTWESEADKNLLISYILYPNFIELQHQFLLNQVISLSLTEVLQHHTTANICIKWPNDIMADNSKIAGILIENVLRNGKIIHTIAGMGLNINQKKFHIYSLQATSLAILGNEFIELDTILKQLNISLEKWYNILRLGNYSHIKNSYQRLLFRGATRGKFEVAGKQIYGIIKGVDDDGKLEIITDDGNICFFRNKEISFVLEY